MCRKSPFLHGGSYAHMHCTVRAESIFTRGEAFTRNGQKNKKGCTFAFSAVRGVLFDSTPTNLRPDNFSTVSNQRTGFIQIHRKIKSRRLPSILALCHGLTKAIPYKLICFEPTNDQMMAMTLVKRRWLRTCLFAELLAQPDV